LMLDLSRSIHNTITTFACSFQLHTDV